MSPTLAEKSATAEIFLPNQRTVPYWRRIGSVGSQQAETNFEGQSRVGRGGSCR